MANVDTLVCVGGAASLWTVYDGETGFVYSFRSICVPVVFRYYLNDNEIDLRAQTPLFAVVVSVLPRNTRSRQWRHQGFYFRGAKRGPPEIW